LQRYAEGTKTAGKRKRERERERERGWVSGWKMLQQEKKILGDVIIA